MPYIYDDRFFAYNASSSAYSARRIVAHLTSHLSINSVLDVGCARGTWLREWSQAGTSDIFGVDGDYLAVDTLEIPQHRFKAVDFNQELRLGRTFTLVQSLEVAEHLRPASSIQFVTSLCEHAEKFVLFSAAPPGQGGEYHVNERAYDYWRSQFVRLGFVAFDFVRPEIIADKAVSFWYRHNAFLYVRKERVEELPQSIRQTEVPAGETLKDLSSPLFAVRKAIVRCLPYRVQHQLARIKSRLWPSGSF